MAAIAYSVGLRAKIFALQGEVVVFRYLGFQVGRECRSEKCFPALEHRGVSFELRMQNRNGFAASRVRLRRRGFFSIGELFFQCRGAGRERLIVPYLAGAFSEFIDECQVRCFQICDRVAAGRVFGGGATAEKERGTKSENERVKYWSNDDGFVHGLSVRLGHESIVDSTRSASASRRLSKPSRFFPT